MAEGFIHSFEGWVIFLICLAVLMAETWALRHIGNRQGHFRYDYLSWPRGPFFKKEDHKRTPAFISLGMLVILAALFSSTALSQIPETIPPHPSFASFPTDIGEWKGHPDHLTPEVLDALNLSDYWLAEYTRPQDSSSVNFYIAYYDSQRVGTTTHSPSNCIPGGGWQITHSDVRPVQLADGTPLKVTRLIIRKDHAAELVYYWFDERGRDLTETYYAKWYLLWDSMTMHRTDGALVRLVIPLADANNEAAGDQSLVQFLNEAYPAIKGFIPGANPAKTVVIP